MSSLKSQTIRLLRWSEKYTKTDMVYLASGGFWLGNAQLIASTAGFALTVILANLLSPEVLGEYRFLISIFLLLSIFGLPGMQTAIMESTPKGFLKNLPLGFKYMSRHGLAGSFAAFILAIYYSTQDNLTLTIGALIISFALPLFDASSLYTFYLKALKQFKTTTIYTLITRSIFVTLAVIAALLFPQYAWMSLAVFLFGQIIPNLFFHYKTVKSIPANAKSDPALLNYARHLTLMAAFAMTASQLDKILIWKYIGAEEVALFYIAYAIPQEILRLAQIAPQLALPKFSTTDIKTLGATLPSKLLKFFIVILCVTIIYIIMAPSIFSLLFPLYQEAVIYTQVLSLTILGAAFSPISSIFAAHKKTKILYLLAVAAPLLKIVLIVAFMPFFGLWGFVYAILLETLVRSLIYTFVLYYKT